MIHYLHFHKIYRTPESTLNRGAKTAFSFQLLDLTLWCSDVLHGFMNVFISLLTIAFVVLYSYTDIF